MVSDQEFSGFYETTLKEQLGELETVRKKILRRYGLGALLLGSLAFLNYYLVSLNLPQYIFIISIAASAIGGLWYIIVTYNEKSEYRASFKSNVVAQIVKLYNPEWQYQFDFGINQKDYEKSQLFPHHCDRYNGDDLVTGQIEKTDFQFSELHTQYKQVTHGTKGQRQEHWVTIFRGLFMHAEFNKNFSGTTYVLPDTAERLFGSFGQSLQKLSSRGDLVKLENVDFEKLFVVYSSDQVEARYILTPAIMEAMVNLATRLGSSVFFSFVGSRIYFARSFSEPLFEPNLFRSGVNYSDLKEMFDLFGLISVLVQEMNLNTRIWTKE
ncbi:MAG: DUF3137 domain-containing protein [Prolixibacteraceae bacterium]|jgi:hypothetical protein